MRVRWAMPVPGGFYTRVQSARSESLGPGVDEGVAFRHFASLLGMGVC